MLQNIIFHTEVRNYNRLKQSTHVMRYSERGSTFIGMWLAQIKEAENRQWIRTQSIDLEAVRKVGRLGSFGTLFELCYRSRAFDTLNDPTFRLDVQFAQW